jgi:phosphatidylinositol dimannoside acyltransferase
MRGRLLRAGLEAVDLVIRSLPSPMAYGLASLLGRAWYRLAPERRALVADTLRRVCEATGRPASGRGFRRMVEQAFVEHARYWVEVLRTPHYDAHDLGRYLVVEPGVWERFEPTLRQGAVIAVPHMGNFEPFGFFVVGEGLKVIAPIEETEPRELFEFLLARRIGGQQIRIVPLRRSSRPMLAALRRGEVVALAADRDLGRGGVPVTMFGHATTLPAGPATLALRTDRPLLMARILRIGPDRYSARAELIDADRSGDQDADADALTRALAVAFEGAIAEAPEQWWAAFQPFFDDQRGHR